MGCPGHQNHHYPRHGPGGRGRPYGGVFRGDLQRGRPPRFCPGPPFRLPVHRHVLPPGRLRISIPDPHHHEARRHQDREVGEADGADWRLQRPLHGTGHHRDRLLLL